MKKKLSSKELDLALRKIRAKYNSLIEDFNKSNSLLNSFEERYISALKTRMDLITFIHAEIQAVDELYQQEKDKVEEAKKLQMIKRNIKQNNTYADKIMQENFDKIDKYPAISLHNNADEEIEKLLGAIRLFLSEYFPVLNLLYSKSRFEIQKVKINTYYDTLITKYDYRGDVPIAKSYIMFLQNAVVDNNKIEYEHKYLMKESAFLLNEIYDFLKSILSDRYIPDHLDTLMIDNFEANTGLQEKFNGLTPLQCVEKVFHFLSQIINDFRIRNIRKS